MSSQKISTEVKPEQQLAAILPSVAMSIIDAVPGIGTVRELTVSVTGFNSTEAMQNFERVLKLSKEYRQ